MAKKKNNKSQIDGDAATEETTLPSVTSPAATLAPKDSKKAPQPSTSALIICRNKYVF